VSVKKQITETDGIYFITITCYNWLHLFENTNSYSAVYNWFNYLRNNGHYITGFVIMPNHLHALITFTNSGKEINQIVGNGKRFMAYAIVGKLKEQKNNILDQLANAVNDSEKKRGK
jgi:REP element-mobilizing transposase RayT